MSGAAITTIPNLRAPKPRHIASVACLTLSELLDRIHEIRETERAAEAEGSIQR